MNPPAWFKDAWDQIVWPGLRGVGRHVRRHPLPVVVAVVVGLTGYVVWEAYRRSASREITVLVGPPGSSGRRMGTRIADQIDVTSPGPGIEYGTSLRTTDGYEEMRDILSTDKKGLTVGFAIDNGGADSRLRVLLPLDWDYLHILVRTKFLQDNFAESAPWPTQLGEVVEKLGERRVFIGPASSGTRRIAKAVLEKYYPSSGKLKLSDIVAPDIADWDEVQSALRRGRIDLAFYTGPIESDTVRQIASEGTAVLLGLDAIADAVAREPSHGVTRAVFPANAYRALPLPSAEPEHLVEGSASRKSRGPLLFCGSQMTALAARRVVVSSATMSEFDAYLLTGAVRSALAGDLPRDPWKPTSPQSPSPPPTSDLRTIVHPGAVLVQNGQPYARWWVPSSWTSTTKSTAIGLLSFAASLLLSFVGERLKQNRVGQIAKQPALPPEAPELIPVAVPPILPQPAAYVFREQLDGLLAEVEHHPEPMSQADFDQFSHRARTLRQEVAAAEKEGDLSREDAEILFHGLRELRAELELLKPVRASRTRKPD